MITDPDLSFEISCWQAGEQIVAGLDEAGRGAWAGPVSAGAVIFPNDPEVIHLLQGVRDSKMMTPHQREYWAQEIIRCAVSWQVGFASHEEIDALGIVPATRLAMMRAVQGLSIQPQHLLIDALNLNEIPLPQTSIIRGDSKSLSIAAASVLAKTARDAVMVEMDHLIPGYGFSRHKGYGTKQHQMALEKLGPCSTHRLSFRPVKTRINQTK